jgi:hypothetical protein
MKAKKMWFQACFPDGAMGTPMKYRFVVKREFTYNHFTFLIGHPPKDEKHYAAYESSTGAPVCQPQSTIAKAQAEALQQLEKRGSLAIGQAVERWLEKYGAVEKLAEWEPEEA